MSIPVPTKVERYVAVTYCDDVREEILNKFSFIGTYRQSLVFPTFPVRILKLCVIVEVVCPKDKQFSSVDVYAFMDENQIAFAHVSPPPEAWSLGPEQGFLSALIPFIFENVEIVNTARIRVRAVFDGCDVIPGPSLVIEQQSASQR